AWAETGKKLNMGKSCIRFKKLEDLPLDVIGESFRRMPARKYIAYCESALAAYKKNSQRGSTRRSSATKNKTPNKKAKR
ncbi:MAG: hypothetical protein ACHP79_14345, partial [Terriglobales bacterium]